MESISSRTIKSGAWVFGIRFVHQIFYFGRIIILARLLSPRDFGLMGIAMLTVAAFDTFSQSGFYEALIQKKENAEDYLDSAWTLMFIRGVFLYAAVFAAAPLAADLFDSPQAVSIIQVMGLSLFLQGLTNISVIYFKKDLKFHKQFIYQIAGTFVDFLVALIVVMIYRNVWALVLGFVAGHTARVIASYVIDAYRPKFEFNPDKIKTLFRYGKWVLGSVALAFLITQGDDFFVGKFLGVTMLGFYQIAYKISNTPSTEITHIISQVTFPAYAKLQDDKDRLKTAYLNVIRVVAFLSFPLAGAIFIFASDLTALLLGKQWMPIVPVIKVLIFAGLFRSFALTAGPVFYAIGKPKLDTIWQIVRLAALAGLIYPLAMRWGLTGASLAVVASIFAANIGFSAYAIKETGSTLKEFINAVYVPVINTAAAVLLVILMKSLMGEGFLSFAAALTASIVFYLLLTLLSVRLFNYEILNLIKENIYQSMKSDTPK